MLVGSISVLLDHGLCMALPSCFAGSGSLDRKNRTVRGTYRDTLVRETIGLMPWNDDYFLNYLGLLVF